MGRERSHGLTTPEIEERLFDAHVKDVDAIRGAAPLGDLLSRILTSLERLMPAARCSVLLLDREQGTLHHGMSPSLPPAYVAEIDGMAIGDAAGSCGTAAALDSPVVAVDVRTDPRWVDFRQAAQDAGLGLPPDFLPRIFTAFARPAPARGATVGEGPGDLAEESIGLGLGLAHGLVAAMGGALSVGSSSPAGTSMVIRMPRAGEGA